MSSSQNQNLQYYLVDNEGFIDFPVVGKIHVVGLTGRECENLVKSKIQPYFKDGEVPTVTVRMASFHVVVTGEVGAGCRYGTKREDEHSRGVGTKRRLRLAG